MKFLLVVHYFNPHIGGMETVVEKQAQSLIDLGHSVTIVTCRPKKSSPLYEVQKNGVVIKRFRSANFIEDIFGITFPIISPHHFFWFLKSIHEYDIVHIHDVFYMPSWLVYIASRINNKSYFLTQHVGIVDHPSKLVIFVENAVYKLFGDRILRRAKKIVAYNDNVVDFLKSRGVKSGTIVKNYNGIDTDYFCPTTISEKKRLRKQYGFGSNDRIVLFVGRLVPKKGYQILLDGLDTDNTYIVVGYGIVPPHYNNLKNVKFFGPASQEQLRDLYHLSDVFAFPSTGEIFTLVHQEALASGLPVVVADDPGYRHYDVNKSLMFMPKRNAKEIAKAIDAILSNATLQKMMGKYSRQIAEKRFSWKNNYPREFEIYDIKSGEAL